MRCLVGIDDTDSSRGNCTTYLAYRIATDLQRSLKVLAYPRLVRLNPNVPFKTRGNAAVCLQIETDDPSGAFEVISTKVRELSDVDGGANSGMVFLKVPSQSLRFQPLYLEALSGIVSHHRVRRFLKEVGAKTFELGNGMGLVGAASSIGFDVGFDHTYELIAYRSKESWGTPRQLDSSSVREMDGRTFPHTFNNYDYQKRKVLIAPHGPDPVFAGVRGDSARTVVNAFHMLVYDEPLIGYMVYISNQHTDAHLQRELDWKVYSSGWFDGTVEGIAVGEGGHTYLTIKSRGRNRLAAAYEPTGDLRRITKRLSRGDKVRAYGGVRRATTLHPMVLNLEKLKVVSLSGQARSLQRGTYISSPRANRHLTKPLIRYGNEARPVQTTSVRWLDSEAMPRRVPVRSP